MKMNPQHFTLCEQHGMAAVTAAPTALSGAMVDVRLAIRDFADAPRLDALAPAERYLAESTDHGDLARRARAWAEYEARQRSLPFVP